MREQRSRGICDHAQSRCNGTAAGHPMVCACGCVGEFLLHDSQRLRIAPGWRGDWFMPSHGPSKQFRPLPAAPPSPPGVSSSWLLVPAASAREPAHVFLAPGGR